MQCDYCGQVYSVQWYRYIQNQKSTIIKDCCSNCSGKKSKESFVDRYGTANKHEVPEIKAKIEATNLKRYGCTNPFGNKEVQDKIRKTNIKKYGVAIPTQNPQIREKATQTNLQKYGEVNYGVIYSREHKKELSPTWKGGVEYHRVERSTEEYRRWRKAVFDRDLYTCQCCKNKNGYGYKIKLHAHHLHNWNDNEQLRYEVDNGITLCDKCHYLFHSIYGKKNNTVEQYYEFALNNADKNIC